MIAPRSSWTIEELADEVGVPVRTIRYYIAEGMLPGPGTRGKGTAYTADHLRRLRLIRRLVEQRVPLADVRQLVERLSPEETTDLLAEDERRAEELRQVAQAPSPAAYITGLLERARIARQGKALPASYAPARPAPHPSPGLPWAPGPGGDQPKTIPSKRNLPSEQTTAGGIPPDAGAGPAPEGWERFTVAPGLELHVRRDQLERYRGIVARILAEHAAEREETPP